MSSNTEQMPFKFILPHNFDEIIKKYEGLNINSITFNIGLYGDLKKTIIFERRLNKKLPTLELAIKQAEDWLNQPITDTYYSFLYEFEIIPNKEKKQILINNTKYEAMP